MRKELDDLLCQRYPDIFRQRDDISPTSCMYRGFECADGWFDLIDQLCIQLTEKMATGEIPPIVATQVKEKLGTLRFRTLGIGNEISQALIRAAEDESERICEVCGNTGLPSPKFFGARCSDHVDVP